MTEEKTKAPLGVLLLGGFNFFVLGLFSLFVFGATYLNTQSQGSQKLLEEFRRYIPQSTINEEQFKVVLLLQLAISAVFALSGLGLLLKREWARRLTLYFSFFIVILAFLAVLVSTSLTTQAIVQVIYPGILIFYLTNKKVEQYFVPSKTKPQEEEKE
jgi:hypothetical protein